jgi:hypothetical protein
MAGCLRKFYPDECGQVPVSRVRGQVVSVRFTFTSLPKVRLPSDWYSIRINDSIWEVAGPDRRKTRSG